MRASGLRCYSSICLVYSLDHKMRRILRGLTASLALCLLFSANACAQHLDTGLRHVLAPQIRKLVVQESVQACHRQTTEEWPRVRCVVRSVRWFRDHSVAVAVLCFDNPDSSRCDLRSEAFPSWKPSNAAVVWRVDGERLLDSRVIAANPSDDIPIELLGVWTSPLGPILVVPLRESGTGNGNLSQWFRMNDALTKVFDGQNSDIHQEVQSRLPRGAFLWKGVWPNAHSLGGDRVPVYRDGDGNCCPTNGLLSYRLTFRDEQLHVASVNYRPPRSVR